MTFQRWVTIRSLRFPTIPLSLSSVLTFSPTTNPLLDIQNRQLLAVYVQNAATCEKVPAYFVFDETLFLVVSCFLKKFLFF
jgi:hypothetical protein